MKASFKQRFLAYLIDLLILGVILLITSMIFSNNQNVIKLQTEYNNVTNDFLNNKINFSTFFNRSAIIYHDLDKQNVIYGIINAFYILIYFVFIPFFNGGYTLGKKILKIRVVRKDKEPLLPNNILYRNLILNGLAYMMICLLLIYILPAFSYYLISIILGIIQIVLLVITLIMVIKDGEGLHDKLGKTIVISER